MYDSRTGVFLQIIFRNDGNQVGAEHGPSLIVHERCAVAIAIERDAEIELFAGDFLCQVAQVFVMLRVRLVVRERAVEFEIHRFNLQGQPGQDMRQNRASHTVAGIDGDVERFELSNKAQAMIYPDVRDILLFDCAGHCGRRLKIVTQNGITDYVEPGIERHGHHAVTVQLDAVFFAGIVAGGDHRAASKTILADGIITHVARYLAEVDDISALFGQASDERIGQLIRVWPHIAADRDLTFSG